MNLRTLLIQHLIYLLKEQYNVHVIEAYVDGYNDGYDNGHDGGCEEYYNGGYKDGYSDGARVYYRGQKFRFDGLHVEEGLVWDDLLEVFVISRGSRNPRPVSKEED